MNKYYKYKKYTIRVEQPIKNLYHLVFPSKYLAAATVLRFQERYECPKFRGKNFSLEEYMDYYAEKISKKKSFTYYEDFYGFNMPSSILRPFSNDAYLIKTSTEKEKALINYFRPMLWNKGDFYLIATHKGTDADTIKHELAHGLYYVNKKYKEEINDSMAMFSEASIEELKRFLKNKQYHKALWTDEIHAFVMCDLTWIKNKWNVKTNDNMKIVGREFRKIFKNYYEASNTVS